MQVCLGLRQSNCCCCCPVVGLALWQTVNLIRSNSGKLFLSHMMMTCPVYVFLTGTKIKKSLHVNDLRKHQKVRYGILVSCSLPDLEWLLDLKYTLIISSVLGYYPMKSCCCWNMLLWSNSLVRSRIDSDSGLKRIFQLRYEMLRLCRLPWAAS